MHAPEFNRRQFLKGTAAAATLGMATGAGYWLTREAIRVGLIGAGPRGQSLALHIGRAAYQPLYGQIVAICDVDRLRAAETQQKCAPHAEIYDDYKKVLERDDIQAVFIATPDHWHAPIAHAAMRAGKAVYCEKPLTLTVDEGKKLVETARQTKTVFQVGSQQRSDWRFQTACELVRNGRLGNLHRVTVSLPHFLKGGPFPTKPIPESLNWDRWLGQAPLVDYCEQRCHYFFRAWYEYSGGIITDWGAHQIDIVQWAMGLENSGPISIDGQGEMPQIPNGFNTPCHFEVKMKYANDVAVNVKMDLERQGILFEGDAGRIFVNRQTLTGKPIEDLSGQPLPEDSILYRNRVNCWGGFVKRHIRDFFDCIKTGNTPIADIASAHRTATACHVANISLRLGRKLQWNPDQEDFVNDAEASAMLSRPQRAPYQIT